MNQDDWITFLTTSLSVVPILKMAKDKRLGFYNFLILLMGVTILLVSINKRHKDDRIKSENDRINYINDSTNKSNIKNLLTQVGISKDNMKKLQDNLDSIGLGIDNKTGNILILDSQILKKFILNPKPKINVTSINQKGGQTAGSIINNK